MQIFILNHFIGATPMDSETIAVFDNMKKAKKGLQKALKDFEISQSECQEYTDSYCYWDLDDFWGGLTIETHTLIKT